LTGSILLYNSIREAKVALRGGNLMMSWLQSIILWAALPLAILLMVATIDVLATVIKTSEQRIDPNR
jgi:hypothetical protein